ncbi:hypothetical protein PHLCEN_2v7286 [Hermanssonia centrifuga]|uniref:Smr domain-containing protein n=1 Tax=Hermanssonia centrifuga TaxID=98765 RepID=A0A2R6NWY1_9APHY|nr:hypothetical protein PHLCEN_2v7286 [Hermanssonia centrifuga]
MENLIAIGVGLGLRALLDAVAHDSYRASALVGIWEGVVLNHFLAKFPSSVDPYIAFAFRLFVDYLFTESLSRIIIIVLWTGLGGLLADVAVQLSGDRRFRRLWRRTVSSLPWSGSHSRPTSSRVRFYEVPDSSSTAGSATPTVASIPVRPTTHPVPGQFDGWSEVTPSTVSAPSEHPSEVGLDPEQSPQMTPQPRTPSELEYISLPVIPDMRDSTSLYDLSARPTSLPPYIADLNDNENNEPLLNAGDDAPVIHSGLTTPTNDPMSLSRPFDDEDRPLIHSGLTTPEHMHTAGLPPIAIFDDGEFGSSIKNLPDQDPVPIRLTIAPPSPLAASIAFPEPQLTPMLLPPTSEIPNIPSPDDPDVNPTADDDKRTPPPSFDEAMKAEDLESEAAAESVVSGGRNTIIDKADEMRNRAIQLEASRDKIKNEMKRARAEKRYADALSLAVEYDETHEEISLLHAKAARRYYRAHNLNQPPQEIDVHRLSVSEANIQVKKAFRDAYRMGAPQLRIITGRGKHSKGGIPVLKLAIVGEMQKNHIEAQPDEKNPGVLIINLPNAPSGSS